MTQKTCSRRKNSILFGSKKGKIPSFSAKKRGKFHYFLTQLHQIKKVDTENEPVFAAE